MRYSNPESHSLHHHNCNSSGDHQIALLGVAGTVAMAIEHSSLAMISGFDNHPDIAFRDNELGVRVV